MVSAVRQERRIGPYAIAGEIAHGASGVILLGHGPKGETVALKTVHHALLDPRFARERRILRELDHPSIVRVRDVVEAQGTVYLAMDYVPGETLRALLGTHHDFAPIDVVRTAIALADALAHAHARDVVHRDVSPANVILTPERIPMLLDFGLARSPDDPLLTGEGEIFGTPAFIAPEVLKAAPVGPAADQFSLGRVLFEMSCRPDRPMPDKRGPLAILTASLDLDWSRWRDGADWRRVRPIVARMVAEPPADRFANIATARNAFLALLGLGPAARDTIPTSEPPTEDV